MAANASESTNIIMNSYNLITQSRCQVWLSWMYKETYAFFKVTLRKPKRKQSKQFNKERLKKNLMI